MAQINVKKAWFEKYRDDDSAVLMLLDEVEAKKIKNNGFTTESTETGRS